MNTRMTVPIEEETCSPASSPSSYSTYWMPLDEPRYAWAAFGAVATLAQALTATGHAFFALAYETKALRYFTLATDQQRSGPRFANAQFLKSGNKRPADSDDDLWVGVPRSRVWPAD